MVEKEYLIDMQKIADYFPLQSTLESMLQLFKELFGLVFVETIGEEHNQISDTGKGEDIV
jgi:metallopeptidase MepB